MKVPSTHWRYTFLIAGWVILLNGCTQLPVPDFASLTTTSPTDISPFSAVGGGRVVSDGGSPVWDRGVCWSLNPGATVYDQRASDGSVGLGDFTSSIPDLHPNTTYYVRAYANNFYQGISYGNELSFTTPAAPAVMDIDGNTYPIVPIGSRTWMAENLRVEVLNDGTPIPLIEDAALWLNSTSPAYCWLDNNGASNKPTYGALYNWYTVATGKLCPAGWHVATATDWDDLYLTTGGGVALKEVGGTHWESTNPGTNESGFTALPGGERDNNAYQHYAAYWWTPDEVDAVSAMGKQLGPADIIIGPIVAGKSFGLSVRCVKDQ